MLDNWRSVDELSPLLVVKVLSEDVSLTTTAALTVTVAIIRASWGSVCKF